MSQENASSCTEAAVLLGLYEEPKSHNLEDIERGIRAYHKDHGKPPSKKSGDALAYVGYVTTWGSINQWLRDPHRPGTLSKLCKEMGLRADHNLKAIKAGVRKYTKEHGKPPSVKLGNALAYVGYPTSWVNINAWLRNNGHESLWRLCKEMGLK